MQVLREKILTIENIKFFLWLLFAATLGFVVAKKGIIVAATGVMVPVAILYMGILFKKPEVGLWTAFVLNYFALGITRYVPAPLGLALDSILLFTHLAIFIKYFHDKFIWGYAKNDLTYLSIIWYVYALFQLVNPESQSRLAWFYAMRGVSLQMLFTIPLVLMLFRKTKHLNTFLFLCLAFSLMGVLKGLMQKFVGLDPWEQRWLNEGGAVTHLLFGKLRIFSFFTDAGQFGAAMGHSMVIFGILAIHAPNFKKKLIYGASALLFFYGLMISGTRGAMAVPFGGFFLYMILKKNIRILLTGTIFGILVFVFFKYTTIGQGNYEIRRIRTAFDKNNPSLQVRLENQRKLKAYLSSRPFGGGIGSAGDWGLRFSPHTFLANVPTDSWYVMIWAEQGIVGLVLHLFILFYVVIKSSYIIMFKLKDPWLKTKMEALLSGMFGIMLASYGNGVFGQMPTGIIIYSTMAFLFMAEKYDKEISSQ